MTDDVANQRIELGAALAITAMFAETLATDVVIDRILNAAVGPDGVGRAILFSGVADGCKAVAETSGCGADINIRRGIAINPSTLPPVSAIDRANHAEAPLPLTQEATLIEALSADYVRLVRPTSAIALRIPSVGLPTETLYLENWLSAEEILSVRLPVLLLIAAAGGAALDRAIRHASMQDALLAAGRSEDAITQTIRKIPAIIAVTGNDGSVEFMSPVWSDYTGLDSSASTGAGWLDVVHPADQPKIAHDFKIVVGKEAAGEYEARIRRHDGVYRWFLFNTRPSRDETGRVVRWYGTAVDIHDQKVAQSSISELQTKLTQVSRLASLGELTASISHEIRQPLAAVLTNAETGVRWLSRSTPDLKETGLVLERIMQNAIRMEEVITRLRQLFGNGAGRRDVFDLNQALDEVMAFTRSDARKSDTAINVVAAGRPLLVSGDRVQIQQVILNLITNAIQAIGISLVRRIDVTTCAHSTNAMLAVADTGCGFAEQDAQTLFDSFRTTKADGMGLGLSISKSIVQDHGGRIWGEPTVPNGAVFRFELPLVAGQAGSGNDGSALV